MDPDDVTTTEVATVAAGAVAIVVVAVVAEPAIEIAGGAEIKAEKSSSKPEDCVVTCEYGNAAVDGGGRSSGGTCLTMTPPRSLTLGGRISGTEGWRISVVVDLANVTFAIVFLSLVVLVVVVVVDADRPGVFRLVHFLVLNEPPLERLHLPSACASRASVARPARRRRLP